MSTNSWAWEGRLWGRNGLQGSASSMRPQPLHVRPANPRSVMVPLVPHGQTSAGTTRAMAGRWARSWGSTTLLRRECGVCVCGEEGGGGGAEAGLQGRGWGGG